MSIELQYRSDPFVASEYVGLPGDRILHVATDPHTGIGCAGRDDYEHAAHDARALNAAYHMGRACALTRTLERAGFSAYGPTDNEPDWTEWAREEIRAAWAATHTAPTGQPPAVG
jgi:hypothetical protein